MIWYTTRSAGQFLFESPSMRRGLLDVLNRNQGVVAVVDLEDNDWTFLDNVSLRFTMSEEEVEATSDPEGELDFDRFVPWVLRKRVNLDESNDG
jgi:hypothetical protein